MSTKLSKLDSSLFQLEVVKGKYGKMGLLKPSARIMFDHPCRFPFGLSRFGKDNASRPSLDIEISCDKMLKALQDLDKRMTTLISEKGTELLGTPLGKEPLESYRPLLKTSETYSPICRAKVSATGAQIWNPDGSKGGNSQDIDLRNKTARVILETKGIYSTGGKCGLTLLITDILLEEESDINSCPFDLAN